MKNRAKHLFAFFWPEVTEQLHKNGALITITDRTLQSRFAIVRLIAEDQVILFDREHHYLMKVASVSSKATTLLVIQHNKNRVLAPTIVQLLPLLKKAALEEAVYSAVECGVNSIYLFMCQKVQRSWGGQLELDRLHKIAIAAAEQSKNFRLPVIIAPEKLNELFLQKVLCKNYGIFFDASGKSAKSIFFQVAAEKPEGVLLLCGPEGDLTENEKKIVESQGIVFCALTPTILRAQQAVAVGLGLTRSLLCS